MYQRSTPPDRTVTFSSSISTAGPSAAQPGDGTAATSAGAVLSAAAAASSPAESSSAASSSSDEHATAATVSAAHTIHRPHRPPMAQFCVVAQKNAQPSCTETWCG